MKQHVYVTVVQCLGFYVEILYIQCGFDRKKTVFNSSSEVLQIFWSVCFVCQQGHGVSSGSALDVVLMMIYSQFAVRISPQTGVQEKFKLSVVVRL